MAEHVRENRDAAVPPPAQPTAPAASAVHRGAPLAMTTGEFTLLRDFIKARFGLCFPPENAYLLERRLQPRLEALQLYGFTDYHDYLNNAAVPAAERERELDELFERIATRETYFFRESYQLDAFRDELLPTLAAAAKASPRLSVWSAGCASGEETYSIAMEVLRSGRLGGFAIDIVGSDWSRKALAAAQRGVYGPSSFRQTEAALQQRFFRPTSGGFEVLPEVRKLCRFVRLNLVADDFSTIGGPFQAIFCRNVLIYFDRATRASLLQRLADKLTPGGYLFLGHSETIGDLGTPLQLARLGREIVYTRPLS
jgi:chemotaxis protein methyltransferase CheR